MKSIKYAYFKLEKKTTTRRVKKNKNNFIKVIGDKLAVGIRWGELTISFCKRFFSLNK